MYIHYGNAKFDPARFDAVRNRPARNKPFGGLWASPVSAKLSWKAWCESSDFATCREDNAFRFRLKDGANVLHIRTKEDVRYLFRVDSYFRKDFDFEGLREVGLDAIELHLSECPELYDELYGWDVDSILVLNPHVIEEETV